MSFAVFFLKKALKTRYMAAIIGCAEFEVWVVRDDLSL